MMDQKVEQGPGRQERSKKEHEKRTPPPGVGRLSVVRPKRKAIIRQSSVMPTPMHANNIAANEIAMKHFPRARRSVKQETHGGRRQDHA